MYVPIYLQDSVYSETLLWLHACKWVCSDCAKLTCVLSAPDADVGDNK